MLFVVVCISLPVAIAELSVGLRAGFSLAETIPPLLVSQLLLFVFGALPIVALAALDARVVVASATGEREIPLVDLHRLPEETPQIETLLQRGELITSIVLPLNGIAARSSYRKVRDRASYAFALVSVAAGLEMEGDIVKDVRVALGGVAHKPWRAHAAEAALKGNPITDTALRAAADAELAPAKGLRDNAFKIELAKRVIVDSLSKLARAAEIAQ